MMWITILSMLLTGAAPDFTGEPEVMGSHQPITVLVGRDVILPCYVRPSIDVRTLTVEWRLNTTLAHVYRNRRDDPKLQHKDFRNRTSLFHNEMSNGNLSLKLSSVNKLDAGNYTCFVPKLDSQVRKGYIALIVEDKDNTPKNKVHSTSATVPEDKDNKIEGSSHKVDIIVGVCVGFGIIIIIVTVVGKKIHGNNSNRVREEERRCNRLNSGSSQEIDTEELNNSRNTDDDT